MFLKKIDEDLAEVLQRNNFEKANRLQKKIIGRIKSGTDALCVAPKGAGKTSTLIIALIQILKRAVDDVPRALVIVPDTDTAIEVAEQFKVLCKHTDLRVNLVSKLDKFEAMRDKVYLGSDIVIGIPSRLDELYKMNGINLTGLKYFILDDASEYMKFLSMSQVHRLSESAFKAQHILFTEQINEGIERFKDKRMQVSEIDDYTTIE